MICHYNLETTHHTLIKEYIIYLNCSILPIEPSLNPLPLTVQELLVIFEEILKLPRFLREAPVLHNRKMSYLYSRIALTVYKLNQ